MRAHTAGLKKEIGILLPACPGSDEQLSMSHWTSLSGLEKKKGANKFLLAVRANIPQFFLALGQAGRQLDCACLRAGKSSDIYLFLSWMTRWHFFMRCQFEGKMSSYIKLDFIVLYCSYLQVLILIVSLDLESLRKLIQEDRLVKLKRFKAIYNTFFNLA